MGETVVFHLGHGIEYLPNEINNESLVVVKYLYVCQI